MTFRRIAAVVLVLVVAGLVVVSTRTRHRARKSNVRHTAHGYAFGLVEVDSTRRQITFPARVARDSGHALVLVNLAGYRWLDDSAALTSSARLLDLQQAIASLDWALWDSLWTGPRPRRPITLKIAEGIPLPQSPRWERNPFREFDPGLAFNQGLALTLGDYVFLGAPEFDPVVLESGEDANCVTCPAFAYEQQTIIAALRRRAANPGYNLKPRLLPKTGTELLVTLTLPPEEGTTDER